MPASSIALPPDVRDFFDRYRDAFDRFDGDAVARLYVTPSGIVSGGRYVHWADFARARANMVALCEHYRTSGHVRSTWEPATVLAQGRDALIVDVVWSTERRGDPLVFHTTYNLIRTSEGWRVLLCTAFDEPAPSSVP